MINTENAHTFAGLQVKNFNSGDNLSDFDNCALRLSVNYDDFEAGESGGLPSAVIKSIVAAQLPALEHLELWLGTDEYGFDGSIETIKPLLNTNNFPNLIYLGLRDSIIADEIAQALSESS